MIVGSALAAGRRRWRRPALRLVHRSVEALQARPVWFFSTDPLADADAETDHDEALVRSVFSLMECVGARGHASFGWIDDGGDGRVPARARNWANAVVDELETRVAPAVASS